MKNLCLRELSSQKNPNQILELAPVFLLLHSALFSEATPSHCGLLGFSLVSFLKGKPRNLPGICDFEVSSPLSPSGL